jgi:hypothetical protein
MDFDSVCHGDSPELNRARVEVCRKSVSKLVKQEPDCFELAMVASQIQRGLLASSLQIDVGT